jgi:hypothetical protein
MIAWTAESLRVRLPDVAKASGVPNQKFASFRSWVRSELLVQKGHQQLYDSRVVLDREVPLPSVPKQ